MWTFKNVFENDDFLLNKICVRVRAILFPLIFKTTGLEDWWYSFPLSYSIIISINKDAVPMKRLVQKLDRNAKNLIPFVVFFPCLIYAILSFPSIKIYDCITRPS